MKFNKPDFWQYKKTNLISKLLLPFTLPIRINNFLINKKKLKKMKILNQFVLEIFMWVAPVKHH